MLCDRYRFVFDYSLPPYPTKEKKKKRKSKEMTSKKSIHSLH